MYKKIFLPLILFASLLLGGCKDDLDLPQPGSEMSPEGTLPVEFVFMEPDGLSTRGTDDYKKLFVDDDVIHIQATFFDAQGNSVVRYGAMRMVNRKWTAVENSQLVWPLTAVTGNFKAYYVYNSDGLFLDVDTVQHTPSVRLSNISDTQDPLEASRNDVTFGHAVQMNFTHACTHLTIEGLDPGISDAYWLVISRGDNSPIKNAFRLKLSPDKNLSIDFIGLEDSDYDNQVYITSSATEYEDPETGAHFCRVTYYLRPGDYSAFELRTNNNYPYLSFQNSLTANLEANTPYVLDVQKSRGVTFESKSEYNWHEFDPEYEVDVETFLRAIVEHQDYFINVEEEGQSIDIEILRAVENGTRLMRNVSFGNFSRYDTFNFLPNVPTGRIFDGNLYYISNLGHPLFMYNYGTIQNLGIRSIHSEVRSVDGGPDNDYRDDYSRYGTLCRWNRPDAVVSNVRVENVDFTVGIDSESTVEVFSVGAVIGSNQGSIDGVALKGDFNLTVKGYRGDGEPADKNVDCTVFIGGIVGYNITSIADVKPRDAESYTMTITNTCVGAPEKGAGVFCVGGAVGYNNGDMEQIVVPNLKIDGSKSDGYQQYTGGIVGRLRTSANNVLSSCTVSGEISSGTVSRYETFEDSFSYIGGISGCVRGYLVLDCRAVCDVHGSCAHLGATLNEDVTYATGGAFGRILSAVEISNNSAFGNVLEGPAESIGSFVGIAPLAETWNELYFPNGNMAKQFSYEYVGANKEAASDAE